MLFSFNKALIWACCSLDKSRKRKVSAHIVRPASLSRMTPPCRCAQRFRLRCKQASSLSTFASLMIINSVKMFQRSAHLHRAGKHTFISATVTGWPLALVLASPVRGWAICPNAARLVLFHGLHRLLSHGFHGHGFHGLGFHCSLCFRLGPNFPQCSSQAYWQSNKQMTKTQIYIYIYICTYIYVLYVCVSLFMCVCSYLHLHNNICNYVFRYWTSISLCVYMCLC